MPRKKTATPAKAAPHRKAPVQLGADILESRFLNRHEAAAYLGCSRKTIREMAQKGAIVEYQLGESLRRYRREDLDAFAESRRTQPRRAK